MLKEALGSALGFAVGKILPERILWIFARRFIAGKDRMAALGTARRLNKDGFRISIDYIGEDLSDYNEIQRVKTEYLALVDAMAESKINGDISLKLSHFGLQPTGTFEQQYRVFRSVTSVLDIIAADAKKAGIRVWIDAERLELRSDTWSIAEKLMEVHGNIGVRIQAYAPDAVKFLSRKIQKGWRGAVGVCKGAYREHRSKVVGGTGLRRNFLDLCAFVAENGLFLQIDTHNEELSYEADMLVGNAPHEHGLLLGVNEPLACFLQRTAEQVNIYGPYGFDVRGYAARRIAERPEYIFLPLRRA